MTNKGPGGHLLTEPVYIEGAEPGDILEVRIQSIKLSVPSDEQDARETVEMREFSPEGKYV